ncbi:hypothetical protein BJY21_003306 [Kineosphaera limosa]|uniref:Uncharacterized protein n=1 Tax=Kineosphaera limosa NBRC 100340 TaxID=1184609 RepID=K6WT61_9MICO|nr:hypothetical protein [Kineosphaera limosa]NYE02122.1 hypothetical protein [Kineosphaera limosa]GAB95277.1 hypothetical protein KILIM_018_00240 [Kineosphaera limosa NBRC 100340]
MSQSPFFDHILRHHFASIEQPVARLPWAAVEVLLVDDGHRRVALGRRMARACSHPQTSVGYSVAQVVLVEDHLLVTGDGLLYLARLRDAGDAAESAAADQESYYVATPARMFDLFVDYSRAMTRQVDCAVTIDCRLDHELDYSWPIDTGLRRELGAHEVMVAR